MLSELKKSLTKFFEKNTHRNLLQFMPSFQSIINHNKIFFKKEPLKGTYTRDILFRTNNYEIILITWGSHSETKIHCHPKNGCLLTVLEGQIREERYDHNDVFYEMNILNRCDFGYMHCDLGKHKVINPNDYNCYTLHIYSPPGFYDKN